MSKQGGFRYTPVVRDFNDVLPRGCRSPGITLGSGAGGRRANQVLEGENTNQEGS